MFRPLARITQAALLAVAVLAAHTVAMAQAGTAPQQDNATIVAAQEYLRASGYVSSIEAGIPAMAEIFKQRAERDPVLRRATVDVRKLALKLLKEGEGDLLNKMATAVAARFTAEELKQAAAFYASDTGLRFADLSKELRAQHRPPADMDSEIPKRFSTAQRSQITTFVNSTVGQKFARYIPEIAKAAREAGFDWGRKVRLEIMRECQTSGAA